MGLLSILALMCSPLFADADTELPSWEPLYRPGDLLISATAGVGFPLAPVVTPSVERVYAGLRTGSDEEAPVSFGVNGRIAVSRYRHRLYSVGWTTVGLAVLATLHMSYGLPAGVPWRFPRNLDFHLSLGGGVTCYAYAGEAYVLDELPTFKVDPAVAAGVNWFLQPDFALRFEGVFWGVPGSSVGLLFKL